MGVITTIAGLHILSCDGLDCNKKVETHNEITLKQVASLSGWKNTGDRWMCPTCVKKEERGRGKKASRRR